jgi:hypothetical protein
MLAGVAAGAVSAEAALEVAEGLGEALVAEAAGSAAAAPRDAGRVKHMKLERLLRHLFTTRWHTRRKFTLDVLTDIEKAREEIESKHSGEVRFVVEPAVDGLSVWRDVPPRQRAAQIFGELGVWDTANDNGVLIYVLLADRDVEILADRGIAARVPPHEWEQICRDIEGHYRAGRFGQGSVTGIRRVGALLARHFPSERGDANELPNQPVLL